MLRFTLALWVCATGCGTVAEETDGPLGLDAAPGSDARPPDSRPIERPPDARPPADADLTSDARTCAACDPLAACDTSSGQAVCACPGGYEDTAGDGSVCTEIDECARGTDLCSDFATCTNSAGSYGCACVEGYSGDGYTCTPNPVTVSFPSTGDSLVSVYTYMWNAGDRWEGTRTTTLPVATQVTVHIPVNNVLSCDNQDMRMLINGVPVTAFAVVPSATSVDFTVGFAPIGGPTYVLRYETTRTVNGGCGAAELPADAGGTVTLGP